MVECHALSPPEFTRDNSRRAVQAALSMRTCKAVAPFEQLLYALLAGFSLLFVVISSFLLYPCFDNVFFSNQSPSILSKLTLPPTPTIETRGHASTGSCEEISAQIMACDLCLCVEFDSSLLLLLLLLLAVAVAAA